MDHVTFVPTADQLAYTFGGAAPVMRIKPGTVVRPVPAGSAPQKPPASSGPAAAGR